MYLLSRTAQGRSGRLELAYRAVPARFRGLQATSTIERFATLLLPRPVGARLGRATE